jgi:hypothetical protein
LQGEFGPATPHKLGGALVCGEQVHRAGRARWMRGRAVPRRTKTAPGWGEGLVTTIEVVGAEVAVLGAAERSGERLRSRHRSNG